MSPTVQRAVLAYERELTSRGLSASTIRVYLLYLGKFAIACGSGLVSEIHPDHVTVFFAGLTSQNVRNLALPALRGFMEWAVRMEYLTADAAARAVGPRKAKQVTRKPKHYIPVTQFGTALRIAGEAHAMFRAFVALALFTLCRQSELAGVQLKHLDLTERKLLVWRQKRTRWTWVTISPDLYRELANWLMWLSNHTGCEGVTQMLREHPDWYVLAHVDRNHGRVTVDPERAATALESIVKLVLDGLGVQSESGWSVAYLGEGGHTFRRSGARALIDYLESRWGFDGAVRMVSRALDHDDIRQTYRYLDLDIDKDRLDAWLRDNCMYGELTELDADARVINMRPAVLPQATASASTTTPVEDAQRMSGQPAGRT